MKKWFSVVLDRWSLSTSINNSMHTRSCTGKSGRLEEPVVATDGSRFGQVWLYLSGGHKSLIDLLVQFSVLPFPEKPAMQVHSNVPMVSVQVALTTQSSETVHSMMSEMKGR